MKVQEIKTSDLLDNIAKQLKQIKEINAPEWSKFVKTGAGRERPPVSEDWWYIRAASILRKISILGPIGVNKLKIKYGGNKNMGHKPERFYPASGKIIRTILQQLETAGLIEKTKKGNHHGRILTAKGNSLLNKKWQDTKLPQKKQD
ncbi:30S ribosomal protein S19e [Candidatus Woesearchaeota archaeon]|nr:30S ribosomal protein S19e [Candidatus Woesearchaeota archaeon]